MCEAYPSLKLQRLQGPSPPGFIFSLIRSQAQRLRKLLFLGGIVARGLMLFLGGIVARGLMQLSSRTQRRSFDHLIISSKLTHRASGQGTAINEACVCVSVCV